MDITHYMAEADRQRGKYERAQEQLDNAAQLRQDRAREVALQCAVTFAAPVPDATENEILGTANIFLPFLLGKDKP